MWEFSNGANGDKTIIIKMMDLAQELFEAIYH
jgi:hypothetical protein